MSNDTEERQPDAVLRPQAWAESQGLLAEDRRLLDMGNVCAKFGGIFGMMRAFAQSIQAEVEELKLTLQIIERCAKTAAQDDRVNQFAALEFGALAQLARARSEANDALETQP